MNKPILCIDFDGVIHSYEKGWQDGEIYGNITPGFFEWLLETDKTFECMVYSSRSKEENKRIKMETWIDNQWLKWCHENKDKNPGYMYPPLQCIAEKPAAFLTIDDRCITFKGRWETPELSPSVLINYKPWTYYTKSV